MAVKQIHLQAPTLFAYGSMTTTFFILTMIITSSWPASSLSFDYTVFNDSIVNLTGDATIQSNSVQISSTQQISAGWVTYPKPMHLWDESLKRLTDFTTEFTFQIYAANKYYGDGMTFFLADPRLKFNKSLANQANLGIPLGPDTNKTLNSSNYRFVAVEFDTFPNEGIDPDRPHVGGNTEMHLLKSWSLNSTLQIDESGQNGSKLWLWLGPLLGLCFFFCFIGCVCLLRWKKVANQGKKDLDKEFERSTCPKRFSYNELVSATNNFADAERLGRGGFGSVYKAFLKDLNYSVAVKRASRGSEQGPKEHVEKQYASEVMVISQLRHKNLVKLIGWCHQEKDFLLVYEFMPNRSLDFHLFEEHNFLTWRMRYNIAQGLVSALIYLQTECEQCVLHRDIKSSNVMLDSNFNAKLGDFGLARLVDHEKGSKTTVPAGTTGYIAPEYNNICIASKESDIFSFGIVALEIACGRKPIGHGAKNGRVTLVEWVWELYGKGKIFEAADPKLRGEFDNQQMEHLMVVGLWCAHPDYTQRPSIMEALNVLNSKAALPDLPKKMPVPTYPHLPSIAFDIENTGANAFGIGNN